VLRNGKKNRHSACEHGVHSLGECFNSEKETLENVGNSLYIRIPTLKFKNFPMYLSKTTNRIVLMLKHHAMKTRRGRLPQEGQPLVHMLWGEGFKGRYGCFEERKDFLSFLEMGK
jgi:hypothetical protein